MPYFAPASKTRGTSWFRSHRHPLNLEAAIVILAFSLGRFLRHDVRHHYPVEFFLWDVYEELRQVQHLYLQVPSFSPRSKLPSLSGVSPRFFSSFPILLLHHPLVVLLRPGSSVEPMHHLRHMPWSSHVHPQLQGCHYEYAPPSGQGQYAPQVMPRV